MTHTPGPWRVGIVSGAVIADHPIEGGCLGSDDVEHYGGHLIAESVAECNKPLIAAAPDLLEALKIAKIVMEDDFPRASRAIGAVIAKATGGAE